MGLIASHWHSEQEFVDIAGIHWPSDKVTPVRIARTPSGLSLDLGADVALKDLADLMLTEWDGGTILAEAENGDLRALVGERHSHGSGGFVALSRGTGEDSLLWLALFEDSNPFTKVRFSNGALEVTSSSGQSWRLPLESPTRATGQPGNAE